jgi:pimeloyl-ACP methyl ester carboxylesterase
VEHLLARIAVPTLVVVGDEDVATTPDKARAMVAGIPGAELVVLPRVGHSSTMEDPPAVNAALDAFYARVLASIR